MSVSQNNTEWNNQIIFWSRIQILGSVQMLLIKWIFKWFHWMHCAPVLYAQKPVNMSKILTNKKMQRLLNVKKIKIMLFIHPTVNKQTNRNRNMFWMESRYFHPYLIFDSGLLSICSLWITYVDNRILYRYYNIVENSHFNC